MYVWFEKPGKAVSGRMGLLVAHAAIGPTNPALPDVEMTSFGVWQGADGTMKVTVPSNGNSFPHLSGRLVAKTIIEEGHDPVIETQPCLAGKQQIDKLKTAITKVWLANPAQVFAPGCKFELDDLNVQPAPVAPAVVIGPASNAGAQQNKK